MSVFDKVVDTPKSVEPGSARLTSQLIDFVQSPELGGMQGLVQKFEKAGLGATVKSWISGEKPLPITPPEITRVFGNDVISRFASKTGLSINDVVQKLTTILPDTISQLTPGGKIPSFSEFGKLGSSLKEKIGI